MEKIFFLIFALMAIASAAAVISLKNPVHSAISLMVCFFQVAAIFVLLRAPFLAAAQVFIYVGAVMVLFLFVIMMLDIRKAVMERFVQNKAVLWVIAVMALLVSQILLVVLNSKFATQSVASDRKLEGSVIGMGKSLFSEYILPFEIISVILLVAMIGAIVMGKREIK